MHRGGVGSGSGGRDSSGGALFRDFGGGTGGAAVGSNVSLGHRAHSATSYDSGYSEASTTNYASGTLSRVVAAASGAGTAAEVQAWWSLAWPTGLSVFCRTAVALVDLAFLGYLGVRWLTAASAAAIYTVAVAQWIWMALAGALSALCAQAYAQRELSELGMWLQTSLFVGLIACGAVAAAWWKTEAVLLLLGLGPGVASDAGEFALWSMLRLVPELAVWLFNTYLQAQAIAGPVLVLSALFVPIHVAACYLCVFGAFGWSGLGFIGVPIASAGVMTARLLTSLVYVLGYRGLARSAWPSRGWTCEALSGGRLQKLVGRYAAPIAGGSLAEQLQLQVIAFFASRLSDSALSAHTAMMALVMVCTSFMTGMVRSTSILVSLHISVGRVASAKRVVRISLFASLCLGLVLGSAMWLARTWLGHAFSSNPGVVDEAHRIAPVAAGGVVVFALLYTAVGTLQGQSRMGTILAASVAGAWMTCVPLGYVLSQVAELELTGLWLALLIGYAVVALTSWVAATRFDWYQRVKHAEPREHMPLMSDGAGAVPGAGGVAGVVSGDAAESGSGYGTTTARV